ncbi:MAG: helix-turn-helix transcriptional regulator [Lachnospiraceae bacterium]|nr:helix-turn-helix transcriptional regulator [Lachnospiraceae bacterium]
MTQEELAFACGYKTRSTINKIEKTSGETRLSTLIKIAAVLEVGPSYLVFGDQDDQDDETHRIFRSLTPEQRDAAVKFLKAMADMNS